MKLSISVMAHPSRAKYFDYLRAKLGDVPFAIDEGVGLLENSKRAWSLFDSDCDYHVVIQDDAIICDDFHNKAKEVLETAEGRLVSFFYSRPGHKKIDEAPSGDGSYIVDADLWGGVAVCIPTHLIDDMIMSFDLSQLKIDDQRIGEWALKNGLEFYYPIPSLVDHRTGIRSVLFKREAKDKADNFEL